MPKIKPALCQKVSLQILLVTSLCVIDCSVRERNVAVAMLTLGKICTADETKEIRSSFAGAAAFFSLLALVRFISTHLFSSPSLGTLCSILTCGPHVHNALMQWGCKLERELNVYRRNSNDGDQRQFISLYSVVLKRANLMCTGINQSVHLWNTQ